MRSYLKKVSFGLALPFFPGFAHRGPITHHYNVDGQSG